MNIWKEEIITPAECIPRNLTAALQMPTSEHWDSQFHICLLASSLGKHEARLHTQFQWSELTMTPGPANRKAQDPIRGASELDNTLYMLLSMQRDHPKWKTMWIDSWIRSINRSQQKYDNMTWQVDYTLTWHKQQFTALWAPGHTEKKPYLGHFCLLLHKIIRETLHCQNKAGQAVKNLDDNIHVAGIAQIHKPVIPNNRKHC